MTEEYYTVNKDKASKREGRGRPRIHEKGTAPTTLGVSIELGNRMGVLKAREEDRLGFKMSYSQFVSMLVKNFEDKENT